MTGHSSWASRLDKNPASSSTGAEEWIPGRGGRHGIRRRGNMRPSLIARGCDNSHGTAENLWLHRWMHDDRASHHLFQCCPAAPIVQDADFVLSCRLQGSNAGKHPRDCGCCAYRCACNIGQRTWPTSREEAGVAHRRLDQSPRCIGGCSRETCPPSGRLWQIRSSLCA